MEAVNNLTKYYYIVYITTNIESKKIYLGVHETTNPEHFDGYLGCGVWANKPSSYNNPKTWFQYAVKKYGPKKFIRKTLKVFETEEEAYLLEAHLVNEEFLARKDVYNMIPGGISGGGRALKCFCYDLNGKFIKEYRSILLAAQSVNSTPEGLSLAMYEKRSFGNYYWDLEYHDILDLDNYQKSYNTIPISMRKEIEYAYKKKIYQYSKKGIFEKSFNTVTEAAKENNCSTSNISRGAKLGYSVNDKYYSYEYSETFDKSRFESIRKRKVYQYNLDGTFIREFENANQAKEELGLKSDIGTAIKKGMLCGNYQWHIEHVERMPDLSNQLRKGYAKRVGVYDTNNNLIETFLTVTECQKKYSACKHVLCGKRKLGNGYIFRYLD